MVSGKGLPRKEDLLKNNLFIFKKNLFNDQIGNSDDIFQKMGIM